MIVTAFPDYEQLSHALAGTDIGAAEAHGIICGVICAPSREEAIWLPLILGREEQPQAGMAGGPADMLTALWHETKTALEGRDFEFALLLPGDESNLAERVEALAEWCRGYVLGLAQSGVDPVRGLSGDAAEILGDIMRIAGVEMQADAETEDQEKALMELEEYMRVGVQVVFDEMHLPAAQALSGPYRNKSEDH